MKALLSSTAAFCLLLAAPSAMAQDHHGHEHHGSDQRGGDHHGGDHHGDGRHDDHHGGDRHGGWDHRGGRNHHDGWHGGGHHDWSRFRHSGHAHHRYHVGNYRWPHGYHYRRWTFGEFLPSIFFSSNYWLNNWGAYGLYAPPPGTRWVRYGPDALLIDRYSGEIIRVEYNAFY